MKCRNRPIERPATDRDVTNATAPISGAGHDPFTPGAQDDLERRLKRGPRDDQLDRQFLSLRPDLQHVGRNR
jgi:hypothetical protein